MPCCRAWPRSRGRSPTTPSGYAADAFGWPGFYVFCSFLAIPGLFFLWLMQRAGFVVESVRQIGVEGEAGEAEDEAR